MMVRDGLFPRKDAGRVAVKDNHLTVVLGGARSGKSAWAEELARRAAEAGQQDGTALPVTYVATSMVDDEEMARRIAAHRQRRPASWKTVEAPTGLPATIRDVGQAGGVILVDCLTVYVSNLLLHATAPAADEGAAGEGGTPTGADAGEGPAAKTAAMAAEGGAETDEQTLPEHRERAAHRLVRDEVEAFVEACRSVPARIIVVTNEVGEGVVPAYPLGRLFRDAAGWANQRVAQAADDVYVLFAGIPVEVKRLSAAAADGSERWGGG